MKWTIKYTNDRGATIESLSVEADDYTKAYFKALLAFDRMRIPDAAILELETVVSGENS